MHNCTIAFVTVVKHLRSFNIICSVRCGYTDRHTPTNAHNLYKITDYPYTRSLLHVSAINCHLQGGLVRRHTKPPHPIYTYTVKNHCGSNTSILDVSVHTTTCKINGDTSINFIQKCGSVTLWIISIVLWLPLFTLTFYFYFYYMCIGCVGFLFFCVVSLWGWRFIAETCNRVYVYGWFVGLYRLWAFVGVCGWSFEIMLDRMYKLEFCMVEIIYRIWILVVVLINSNL
jgi:hypothetical protein